MLFWDEMICDELVRQNMEKLLDIAIRLELKNNPEFDDVLIQAWKTLDAYTDKGKSK